MTETGYLLAAVAIAGCITLALRAIPFAVLTPLRKSKIVQKIGRWMPAGILFILVVALLFDQAAANPQRVVPLLIACAVTVCVHLFGRRRALLSIVAGTACYILLVNTLW